MNENLQFDVGHSLVNGAYLVDGEFAGQDDAGKAQVTQPCNFLGRAVIGLSAGVNVER